VTGPTLPQFLQHAQRNAKGQSELRLHPADVHVLERLLDAKQPPKLAPMFMGLRVVADSSRERIAA
jgi:hypothetical protein